MFVKYVFQIIIVAIALCTPEVGLSKSIKKNSQIISNVNHLVQQAITNIKKSKKIEDRIEVNQKLISSIRELRLKNELQKPQDEFYLDMLTDSLKSIPSASQFKLDSCSEYKSNILRLTDPNKEGQSDHPSVNLGLEVLKSICSQ